MTDFDRLGRRIAHEQDDLRARAPHRAQIRERIDALSIPHAPSLDKKRGRWLAAGSGIAATAALAAIWLLLARGPAQPPIAAYATRSGKPIAAYAPRSGKPIAAYAPRSGKPIAAYAPRSGKPIAVGAWIEAPGPEAFAIRFSDGTRVEIASHTRARLVEIDAAGAHLLLESGRAHLEVAHRPHARWRVSAGPFAVHVIGTRFDVQWNPEQDRFQLDLAQGAVEVAGCAVGSGYHMRAGQRLEASCKDGRFDIADATRAPAGAQPEQPRADSDAAADGSRSAIAARSEVPPAAKPASTTVREASAQRGKRPRAQLGEFEAKCVNADVEALASLADAAHYAGDREREGYAWRLLRRRFPGTSRAALAAFALGRLEFDVHGSYSKAAEWFGTYLKEQPAGALVREARGRLLEATLRAGDARAARALGAAYLRDYPAGPHADLARNLEPTPSP